MTMIERMDALEARVRKLEERDATRGGPCLTPGCEMVTRAGYLLCDTCASKPQEPAPWLIRVEDMIPAPPPPPPTLEEIRAALRDELDRAYPTPKVVELRAEPAVPDELVRMLEEAADVYAYITGSLDPHFPGLAAKRQRLQHVLARVREAREREPGEQKDPRQGSLEGVEEPPPERLTGGHPFEDRPCGWSPQDSLTPKPHPGPFPPSPVTPKQGSLEGVEQTPRPVDASVHERHSYFAGRPLPEETFRALDEAIERHGERMEQDRRLLAQAAEKGSEQGAGKEGDGAISGTDSWAISAPDEAAETAAAPVGEHRLTTDQEGFRCAICGQRPQYVDRERLATFVCFPKGCPGIPPQQ